MNAKIKMRQYDTFLKPRNFDATDIKCFTVGPYQEEESLLQTEIQRLVLIRLQTCNNPSFMHINTL